MSFSSLQTTLAQTKISGSGKEVDLFVSIMRQNKSSLAIAENLLALTTKNDELVIFNGRICGFYPFVRASEKSGRNYYCFRRFRRRFRRFVRRLGDSSSGRVTETVIRVHPCVICVAFN